MKVFVPFSDVLMNPDLMDQLGLSTDDLVPFDLEYEVLRPELAQLGNAEVMDTAAAPA